VRHGVFGRKLGRDINSRKALLANLASDLFINKSVVTTLAKAKFARVHAEKLVTDAKRNKLFTNRSLASNITHKAFLRLTSEIAPGFSKRSGGYTRIIKLSSLRNGDAAPMARLELLEWEKIQLPTKASLSKAIEKPIGDKKIKAKAQDKKETAKK